MPSSNRSRSSPAISQRSRAQPHPRERRSSRAAHRSPPSAGFVDSHVLYRQGMSLRDLRRALMPEKRYIPLFYAHEFPEVRRVVDARVEILRQRNEVAERDPDGTLFLPGEVFDLHAALREDRARRAATV